MVLIQLNIPRKYKEVYHHGAATIFTYDGGNSRGDFRIVAQDARGIIEYHDKFGIVLPDDQGTTCSSLQPTNLRGQVCAPILLKDGKTAAVYNYRQFSFWLIFYGDSHFDRSNRAFECTRNAVSV